MPQIIQCTQCQKKLNVPDQYLGKAVKCPGCGSTFMAPPGPEAVAEVLPAEPVFTPSAPPPRPLSPNMEFEQLQAESYQDQRWDSIAASEGQQPHRGALILTLGIISLCLSCCPLVAWIMGGITMGMARNDQQLMYRNRMDRSGMGITRAGGTCATIAVVLGTIFFFLNIFIRVANMR